MITIIELNYLIEILREDLNEEKTAVIILKFIQNLKGVKE